MEALPTFRLIVLEGLVPMTILLRFLNVAISFGIMRWIVSLTAELWWTCNIRFSRERTQTGETGQIFRWEPISCRANSAIPRGLALCSVKKNWKLSHNTQHSFCSQKRYRNSEKVASLCQQIELFRTSVGLILVSNL